LLNAEQNASQGVEALVSSRNDVSSVPTSVLMISNLISTADIELIAEPKYYNEIKEEVKSACAKHGTVENVLIESSADGNIWVKFSSAKDAKQACEQLNNKNYNGRQILCTFAKEESYMRRLYPVQ
jgi:hypothetical protein